MLNSKMSPSGLRSDAEPPDAPVCSFAGLQSSLEYLTAPSGSYSSGLEHFAKDSPSIDNACLAHSLLVTTELCQAPACDLAITPKAFSRKQSKVLTLKSIAKLFNCSRGLGQRFGTALAGGTASANTGRFRVGAGSKRLDFANFPGAQSLITCLIPALVMEIRPETIYPQILSTPLHVGAVFPNTTPYGSLRPHDPTALLHSITVCFPVFPLLLFANY